MNMNAARPRTPILWDHSLPRTSAGPKKQARVFDGPVLIAAEEARSSPGGQYAQMPPRADAALARPRPAPGGWCKQCRVGGAPRHGRPVELRIAHLYIFCIGSLRQLP